MRKLKLCDMTLQLTELARDYLTKRKGWNVIAGVISPVHIAYGKKVSTGFYILGCLKFCALIICNNYLVQIHCVYINF